MPMRPVRSGKRTMQAVWSAHRKGMKEGELLNQQHILIKLLSRKFGLTEAEKELICSTDNLEKLEKAIEETVFKDSKSQLLNYLK